MCWKIIIIVLTSSSDTKLVGEHLLSSKLHDRHVLPAKVAGSGPPFLKTHRRAKTESDSTPLRVQAAATLRQSPRWRLTHSGTPAGTHSLSIVNSANTCCGENGLRSSHPSAEAGGVGGGRAVQEHLHASFPAWTSPAREAQVPLRWQKTTQVRVFYRKRGV